LSAELAGEKIQSILTHAPGNGAAIGGLKVVSESGWFAARRRAPKKGTNFFSLNQRSILLWEKGAFFAGKGAVGNFLPI